jgi:hypothetical protein
MIRERNLGLYPGVRGEALDQTLSCRLDALDQKVIESHAFLG